MQPQKPLMNENYLNYITPMQLKQKIVLLGFVQIEVEFVVVNLIRMIELKVSIIQPSMVI